MTRLFSGPRVGILAAVLVVIAGAVLLFPRSRDTPEGDKALFGESGRAALDDPRRLVVRGGDSQTTLEKRDGRWSIAERDGYPADAGRVAAFLERLRNPRVLRPVAPGSVAFGDVGIGDEAEPQSWHRRITVMGPGEDGPRGDLVVGYDRSVPGSADMAAHHVRRAGTQDVWLVDRNLAPAAEPTAWMDQVLAAVPRDRIAAFRTAPADGTALAAERAPEGASAFHATSLGPDAGQPERGTFSTLATTFTRLEFTDVRRADPATVPDSAGYLETRNGARFRFWFDGPESPWVHFVRTEAPADTAQSGNATSEKADLPAPERLDGWAYRLPGSSVRRLRTAAGDIRMRPSTDTSATD